MIYNVESAINRTNNDLLFLREARSKITSFRARAKWFEQGEKSNKYFLNLNKKYKKQKLMEKIICDNITYRGQEQVKEGIAGFYQRLYDKNEVEDEEQDTEFYDKCPKLSQDARNNLDSDITEAELLAALMTCSDSAPGSDGIPYSVYKKLWSLTGKIITVNNIFT